MLSAEEIAGLYKQRQANAADRHARMRDVSDVYYGRVDLPLPELSKNEQAAVPNLCQQGTDQMARRVASVLPNMQYPSLHPGFKDADSRGDLRRAVNYGWWGRNKMRKVLARRARWYITYASAPAVIRPDEKLMDGGGPKWDLVSPFDILPAHTHIDCYTPDNVIIRHTRTLNWLKELNPEAAARVAKKQKPKPDDTFDVLEYIDGDEIVFCVCGHERTGPDAEFYPTPSPERMAVELTRVPNRAGICWAVIPERVSLDAPAGQFDTILGMYATQAALMALQIHAARKAIWPTTWLVNPNTNAIPNIVQDPDPRTGTPGVVTNGILDRQQLDPGFRGQEVIDRLEGSQRQTAALPAELGGSGSQNVRTGRRGSQIMSASIDFTIAEAQDAFAEALDEENKRARAIDKAYFDTKKTFYVTAKGIRGKITYKPSDIWEKDAVGIVEYPIAGTDLSDLVINGGQRVGMGTMSKRRFMEIDPMVDDVDADEQQMRLEGIENAFFSSVQNLVAMPEGPLQPHHIAELRERVRQGQDFGEAYLAIHKELQEAQAEGAPAGAPETQSGLGMPGQGSEIPSIPGLGPSSEDMTSLLSQLGVTDVAVERR